MQYRRIYVKGGTYFFTVVTYDRYPIFSTDASIKLLSDAFRYTNEHMLFTIVAAVILPDHMHYIWTLPEESSDFSTRWRLIKSHFSRHWKDEKRHHQSISRINKGEKDIWQRRFWEHLIRNDIDFSRHIEYIHYNPVKHGYVSSAKEWNHSTFSKYVEDGLYPMDWGESRNVWSGQKLME